MGSGAQAAPLCSLHFAASCSSFSTSPTSLSLGLPDSSCAGLNSWDCSPAHGRELPPNKLIRPSQPRYIEDPLFRKCRIRATYKQCIHSYDEYELSYSKRYSGMVGNLRHAP